MLLIFLLANYAHDPAFALIQNVALRKVEQLTLKCKVQTTSKFIGWHHIQVGNDKETPVSNSSNTISLKAKVEGEHNTSILTIFSVQMSDAGVYGCRSLKNSSVSIERAQVIVLDGNIRIFRQNSSHVSCEAEYNGNWAPELQLTGIVAGRPETMHTANQTLAVNLTNGNQMVIAFMEMIPLESNLTNYSCQLYFANQSSPFGETVATNVPTYRDNVSCTSDSMNSSCYTEQVTTTKTSNLHSTQISSSPNPNPILVNLLATLTFVCGILLTALIVAGIKRRRKKTLTLIQSKTQPIAIPNPDILDGSEEGSNGFSRALPEHSTEEYAYAEVAKEKSNAESAYGNSGTKQNRIVGADGTEYMSMNTLPRDIWPPPTAPSAFPPTVYASIDHLQTQIPSEF